MVKIMNGLTLKDVLNRVVHENRLSPRQLAEELGMSYSMLTNAANPDLEEFRFAARHLIPITRATKDFRLFDFMEAAVGRVAFSLPELPTMIDNLPCLVADNVREFGDVLTAIGSALENGRIGEIEIKKIEVEILEQVRTAMALLEAAKRVAS